MLDEISTSHQPAAQYLTRYTEELYYLWDELAAAAANLGALASLDAEFVVDQVVHRAGASTVRYRLRLFPGDGGAEVITGADPHAFRPGRAVTGG